MRKEIARRISVSVAKLLRLNYVIFFFDDKKLIGEIDAMPNEVGTLTEIVAYHHPGLFESVAYEACKNGDVFQNDELITNKSYPEEVAEHGMD